jgi:hypothetical protein
LTNSIKQPAQNNCAKQSLTTATSNKHRTTSQSKTSNNQANEAAHRHEKRAGEGSIKLLQIAIQHMSNKLQLQRNAAADSRETSLPAIKAQVQSAFFFARALVDVG